MKPFFGSNRIKALLVGLVAIAVGLIAGHLEPVRALAMGLVDLQTVLTVSPERAARDIVLIEVDQASLDHFEEESIPWPWPRAIYAPLIDYVTAAGSRAILFDILFNNLSPYGSGVDQQFAEAIEASGKVWLAAALTRQADRRNQRLPEWFSHPFLGQPPAVLNRSGATIPLPRLAGSARGVGIVSARADRDGVYRRLNPLLRLGDRLLPTLALAPLLAEEEPIEFRSGEVVAGKLVIPIDSEGAAWLRYHGPRGSYRRYTAAEVIRSAQQWAAGEEPIVPLSAFSDAWVIVGYSAPGLYDLKPTPLSPHSPGMEIHATALDNLLNGDLLAPLSHSASLAIAILASLLIVILIVWPDRTLIALAGSGSLLSGLFLLSLLSLHHGVIADTPLIVTTILLAMTVTTGHRLLVEGRERALRDRSLARIVSPGVAEWLLADPSRLERRGETRTITILFTDLAGFTSTAEALGGEATLELLNAYLEEMTRVVFEQDGTLNKFIGDAVLAFWGAPRPQADQSLRAVEAALAGLDALEALKQRSDNPHINQLSMRIGIDRGECMVGNIGALDRIEYTAIGDAVNQASRLEGLNKAYGTMLLVSGPVWEAIDGACVGRRIDRVRVKGKTIPVDVYQPVAMAKEGSESQRLVCAIYEEAWDLMRKRDWQGALELLARLADDPASRALERRIAYYQDHPPADDWDGTFTHTSK